MNRLRTILRAAVIIFGSAVPSPADGGPAAGRASASGEASPVRPVEGLNFVLVLCDDLGYGDLGSYGNEIVHTPHLDRFASEGLRFTDCYAAAANCSPSRTGLMTGRTPWRVGVFNWIPMMSPMHVKESEITVATLLRNSGYATCVAGKWHLNGRFNLPGQPQPGDHGFDHWFATQNNCLPNHRNPWNFVRNGEPAGRIEGYAADIVTDEAIRWLRAEGGGDRPAAARGSGGQASAARDPEKAFFLFVSYHEPHEPIATAERHARLYRDREDPAERAYWGNITQMDAAFGRLMAEIDSLGLREDTVVFFTSDNGPAQTRIHPYGSAGPLRAKKGHLWDGGIRVPGILRWPGKVKPGSTSEEPVCGVDVLPTICEIAGVDPPSDRVLDGASWLPFLEGKTTTIAREQPLYWHFARAKSDVKVAMREGDWKMVARMDEEIPSIGANIDPGEMDLYKSANMTEFELFNLREDMAESMDLKEREQDRFKAMRQRMIEHYENVREESPVWPEWEWPRYEGRRIEWPSYKALIRPPDHE